MIARICIKNFALIENTEIEFNQGLNVLSGETGSGKSIILDALNFALGAKADKSIVRYGATECIVSAEFTQINSQVKEVLLEQDIECDDDIVIVKRKFNLDGKSSIKINGETATVSMLRKITSKLVDIHGQSEHFYLLSETNQLEVLDKFCGDELLNLKEQLKEPIDKIKTLNSNIRKLEDSTIDGERRTDILKFQIEEIESADIKENEEEELLDLRKKIINSEKIISSLSEAKGLLSDENSAVDLLAQAVKRLSQISDYSEDYSKIYQFGEELLSQIGEMEGDITDKLEQIDFSPEQADEVEKRLDLIRDIKKKYGKTIEEINLFKENAQIEYDNIVNGEKILQKWKTERDNEEKVLTSLYQKITQLRKAKAKEFSSGICEQLKTLSMKSAQFDISFSTQEGLLLNGIDKIEFNFSANLGEPLKSMSKVISGGEMSRLMLSLKCQTSSLQEIPTYIFDEIDAGISGVTAQVVAEKLADISKQKQIIAISHLPQIAAMSDTSYLIYKFEDENKTYSSIKMLDEGGKISEIIRLIGGDDSSESAKIHAREMLNKANAYKTK